MSWSMGAFTYGSELVSVESEKWAKKLYQVEYDKRNWSWVIGPNIPYVPLVVPKV